MLLKVLIKLGLINSILFILATITQLGNSELLNLLDGCIILMEEKLFSIFPQLLIMVNLKLTISYKPKIYGIDKISMEEFV